MKVAIGSKNLVKIRAVKKAFACFWPKQRFEFVGLRAASGVKDQPRSDKECIKGAFNRAKKAQQKTGADFSVGIEGGICEAENLYFARAWMVVINKKGETGIGSSLSAPLSQKFMNLIDKGFELGKANDIITGRKNTKQKEGYFGLISDNLITREKGYRDGIIMALAKFKKTEFF